MWAPGLPKCPATQNARSMEFAFGHFGGPRGYFCELKIEGHGCECLSKKVLYWCLYKGPWIWKLPLRSTEICAA